MVKSWPGVTCALCRPRPTGRYLASAVTSRRPSSRRLRETCTCDTPIRRPSALVPTRRSALEREPRAREARQRVVAPLRSRDESRPGRLADRVSPAFRRTRHPPTGVDGLDVVHAERQASIAASRIQTDTSRVRRLIRHLPRSRVRVRSSGNSRGDPEASRHVQAGPSKRPWNCACAGARRDAPTWGSRRSRCSKFDTQDQATNAVILGRADAMSADSPLTSYEIKQRTACSSRQGEIFDSAPYGWPAKKGSALAAALQKALEHLIETGEYKTHNVELGCRVRDDRQAADQRRDLLSATSVDWVRTLLGVCARTPTESAFVS